MKRTLLLFFSIAFLIGANAQSIDTENTILQSYQIQIAGATDLASAKELATYDYMEPIFNARPVFNVETLYFEVKSYELVSLDQLKSKLEEFGLTVTNLTQSPDYSQPK